MSTPTKRLQEWAYGTADDPTWTDYDAATWVYDVHNALDEVRRELAELRKVYAISVQNAPLFTNAWDVLRHLDAAIDEIERERAEFLRKH